MKLKNLVISLKLRSHFIYGLLFSRDLLLGQKVFRDYAIARLGSRYGGWNIPVDLVAEDSIVYCAGCGEDISFDLDLIEKIGCKIYAFDPTPRSIDYVYSKTKNISKYKFKAVGLWDDNANLKFYKPQNLAHVSHSAINLQNTEQFIEVPVSDLQSLMAEYKHEYIDLLKLDIEGAEYKVLKYIVEHKVPVKVLCVEFDEFLNPMDHKYKARIRSAVADLEECGYRLVHSEYNGNYTFVKLDSLNI